MIEGIYDWYDGEGPCWCKCIQGTGVVVPNRSNQNVIAYFRDEDKRIDLNFYDEYGDWSHMTREYILNDAEYFKRKLNGS